MTTPRRHYRDDPRLLLWCIRRDTYAAAEVANDAAEDALDEGHKRLQSASPDMPLESVVQLDDHLAATERRLHEALTLDIRAGRWVSAADMMRGFLDELQAADDTAPAIDETAARQLRALDRHQAATPPPPTRRALVRATLTAAPPHCRGMHAAA